MLAARRDGRKKGRKKTSMQAGATSDENLTDPKSWMSNTEESPVLDPPLQEVTVKTKKVETSVKKKKRKLVDNRKQTENCDAQSLRQCLGPSCVYPARPGSKYCSDDCGMKLAADRIYEILPHSLQQWQKHPSIAEQQCKKMLERIRQEQRDTHTRLKELENHFLQLEAIIQRGKQETICKDQETKCGKDVTDVNIFCVSCGQSISTHIALRHMERCFVKYECQSSYGSLFPTCIEGTTRLFCDVYNPTSKRYCKRLQVLCPEHSREPKVADDEVCGCPLVHNVFELTGDFCRLPKRLCNSHYCWEKLRRAEVDLERVRALQKLEELFEQERKVRTTMANRAGVLGLMLHQTTQHDPFTSDLRSKEAN